MPNQLAPKISKWPFFAGDMLLLATAFWVSSHGKLPLGASQISFAFLFVAAGAGFGILPFLLEYRVVSKLAEASALTTVVSKMNKLERWAGQIGGATGKWQTVQKQADKTAGLAKGIADRMTN